MVEVEVVTIKNLLNKKYKVLPFTGAWYDAFGKPTPTGTWFIYGLSAQGKTSFAHQLARYLDELGLRIAYLSLEEVDDYTVQLSARRSGWKEIGSRIMLLKPTAVNNIDKWMQRPKAPDVLMVDTIQYWDLTFKRYLELKKKHARKLFIFVSHVKADYSPDGSVANKIMRDASLKIFVNGFRAISQGRFIGPKEYYSVWPDKEKEYWLESGIKSSQKMNDKMYGNE